MKLKIKADDSNLEIINDFIHNLIPADCNSKILNEIDLAVEEIFVNIAHYAYKDLLSQQKNAAASSTDSSLGFAEIICDFDSHKELRRGRFPLRPRGEGGVAVFLRKEQEEHDAPGPL